MRGRAVNGVLRTTACSLLVLGLVAGAGCGSGSSHHDPTVQAAAAPASSTPPVDEAAQARARAAGRRAAVKRASDLAQEEVRSYYTAIDGQDFATAWDKLGAFVQDQLGGRDQWEKGFKDHLSNDVSLSVSSATASSASVAVTLTSKDVDACARTVTQTFEGTWQVEPISGNWIATALDMRRTSGHAPETDINKCLPSTPTPSTP